MTSNQHRENCKNHASSVEENSKTKFKAQAKVKERIESNKKLTSKERFVECGQAFISMANCLLGNFEAGVNQPEGKRSISAIRTLVLKYRARISWPFTKLFRNPRPRQPTVRDFGGAVAHASDTSVDGVAALAASCSSFETRRPY